MNSKCGRYNKKTKDEILKILEETYTDAHCELNFRTPFELLVATMLSAQSTDKTVNKVTEKLFEHYKSPEDFVLLKQSELETKIKEIGLYRNKAKNILLTCHKLIERFDGQVPSKYEELISLPGVGRKTANVVLSNAFGVPAIAVDTHVFRVSNRIGLAESKNADDTERQLMESIPRGKWSSAHHWLIWHGRRICDAKKPKCDICPIKAYCKFYKES